MQFIPNTHRKQSLVVHDYIFMKGKDNKDGSVNWRCQNSRKVGQERCPITCTTLNGELVRRPPIKHIVDGRLIHEPQTQGKKDAMQCIDSIKTEVKQTMQPLKQLYEKSVNKFLVKENVDLAKFIDFSLECPDYENVRSGLGKIRREDTPLLPKSKETIDLDGQYLITIYGQRFLLFDTKGTERIIAYSSNFQMEILGLSSQWHADGTFKTAPHLFAQNYLIHGWLNNEMWPCVTVLMPDRQKKPTKR